MRALPSNGRRPARLGLSQGPSRRRRSPVRSVKLGAHCGRKYFPSELFSRLHLTTVLKRDNFRSNRRAEAKPTQRLEQSYPRQEAANPPCSLLVRLVLVRAFESQYAYPPTCARGCPARSRNISPRARMSRATSCLKGELPRACAGRLERGPSFPCCSPMCNLFVLCQPARALS